MPAAPRVPMVIPYHSSGMNPVFAKLMGSDFYRDYTAYHNTTVKQLYNSEGQPVSLKLEKKQTEKLTGGFMWNKVLQETGDARAAAEAYKDWCADASKHTVKIDGKTYTAELNPKFADFKGETNYYKLLTDFNPYDCITEEAAPQGDVQQVFPQDFEKILRGELTAQEAHRQKQEKNQAFDKAMGEIEDYLKSHKTSKQLHEAGMKQKVPVERYVDKSADGGYNFKKSFAQQLEDFEKGLFPQRDTLLIGKTPWILRKVGLASIPLTMDRTHVDYALNGTYPGTEERVKDHMVPRSELEKLPDLIADPVAIIQDKQTWQKKASGYSVDVLVEMEINKKKALVALNVNSAGHINSEQIDSNRVSTLHGDVDTVQRLINALNENSDTNHSVYYINKEKASAFLRPVGNPISKAAQELDGFVNSVTDQNSSVKMRISDVTESLQFIRWFGDWKNDHKLSSKVVNRDGTPQIVYHGTNAVFAEFKKGDIGYHVGTQEQAADRIAGTDNGHIMALYASIKNPLYAAFDFGDWHGRYVADMLIETEQFEDHSRRSQIEKDLREISNLDNDGEADEKLRAYLKKMGYDGIAYENRFEGSDGELSYIAFDSTQLKSATDNLGTFDKGDPDIYYKTPTNQEVSNRTLLEKAAEDPNMHEVLKKRIQDYVANDDAFQKEESKLTGLREEIRDLSLANRKEDAANMGFPKGTQEMWEYITQKKKP